MDQRQRIVTSAKRKQAWILFSIVLGAAALWLLQDTLRSNGPDADTATEKQRTASGSAEREDDSPSRVSSHSRPAPSAARTSDQGADADSPATTVARTVTGVVTRSSDNLPVAWVDVIFFQENSDRTATSDETGRYSIVLSPGSYSVRALGEHVVALDLPKLEVRDRTRTYDVTVVQQAVVRGRVVYADGTAAVGTTVMPQRSGKAARTTGGALGMAETGEDGSFELSTIPGNLTLFASENDASGTIAVRALRPGEVRSNVTLRLIANGTIGGTVRTPNNKPAAGAMILVSVRVPGTTQYDRIRFLADEAGRFQWQVPRAGHLILDASLRGFAQSVPRNLNLEPGEDHLDLQLALQVAELSLTGRVVDTEGRPLSGVQIAQGREGSKARYRRVYTEDDGGFEVAKLGPGPHRLRARKTGYKQTRVRGLSAPATEIVIVMPRKETIVMPK